MTDKRTPDEQRIDTLSSKVIELTADRDRLQRMLAVAQRNLADLDSACCPHCGSRIGSFSLSGSTEQAP